MTRKEILLILIGQAQSNGFEFHRWFQANISAEWTGIDEAVALLTCEGRYFALVFSHDFARALWKKGAQMQFIVPATTYARTDGKGDVITINRKPFTRRTIKANVWKYHIRQMSLSEDPIRYLKRFVPTQEDLSSQFVDTEDLSAVG
jgi:hypothetical protein